MKRIHKSDNSLIIKENLEYPKDTKQIREILEKEQFNFCAYTEKRISSTYTIDIEHFNPQRKNIIKYYNNWYAVGHKWNNKKSSKWENFQPVLHPSDESLEDRIFYDEKTGTYQTKIGDFEAINLLKLLDLNNFDLSQERRAFIKNIKTSKYNDNELIDWLKESNLIEFRRALETVFSVKL